MVLNLSVPELKELKPKITVFGVGGAGGNAINNMIQSGLSGVEFVAANTDAQALSKSLSDSKMQLGVQVTKGLGAGSHPDIGKSSADETKHEIMERLEGTNMLFITAGMGGGTGTGAAPVIAQMSKQLDILTVGIVTIPFQFEGRMRSDQAQIGIQILRENVDSLIVINNNKLRQVYGNLGFKAGFAKADEVLATAARGIAEVITHHYRQNIDLKDAKTVLSNSGTAIMGSAIAEGSNRAEESVLKALDSPLLNDNKIKGCKNVLLLIVSGEEEITIDEIGEINDLIQTQAGNNTNIIMGIGEEKNLKQGISVTIIATGFNSDQQHEIVNTEAKKIIHTLEEDQSFVQDLSDDNDNLKNKGISNSDEMENNISFDENNFFQEEKLKHPKISKVYDEKSHHSQDFDSNGEELIKTNRNIKNIETISSHIFLDSNDKIVENDFNAENNESIDSIETIDFERINDLDSTQIEFDFNECHNDSIKKESININSEEKSNVETLQVNKKDNINEISEMENLEENSELDNPDEEELKIKIKKVEEDGLSNNEMFEIDIKNETPFDNSIEETVKNASNFSNEELKKYNYSFQNNLKRINEMDNQPAYKRLGYNIDHKTENEKKSSLTLNKDKNDEIQLRSNNSFLHDNVD